MDYVHVIKVTNADKAWSARRYALDLVAGL